MCPNIRCIEAVSETKTEHVVIPKESIEAKQCIQNSTLKDKDAEGSDQHDSVHRKSEMKNVQTGNFSGETTECLEKSLPVQLSSFAKTATTDDLPSPKKDNCISSAQNTETEANKCQNEDELSRDTTELKGDPKDVKEKKDEYLYRLLRFDEKIRRGLYPKDIRSNTSLKEHIERGSRGIKSRFISCCKTIRGLEKLASHTNEFHRVRLVVRINITQLNPRNVNVIDLTDESVRLKYFKSNKRAWRLASKFDEVILEPKRYIPRYCIEKIGTVKDQSFTKYQNIIL